MCTEIKRSLFSCLFIAAAAIFALACEPDKEVKVTIKTDEVAVKTDGIALENPVKPGPENSNSPIFGANSWASRGFGDLSLEAPFEISKDIAMEVSIPLDVRDKLEFYETYDNGSKFQFFKVAVSRIGYRAGEALDLDGAVNGAMVNATKGTAESPVKFDSKPVQVDGVEARRVSWHGEVTGRPLHVEGVFARSGQRMWHVIAIYTSDDNRKDATRLLDSVHITPAVPR